MKKKRLILITGTLMACSGLALGVFAIVTPRPGVTKAKFDRIQEGMTQDEVEKLFGGPPHRITTDDGMGLLLLCDHTELIWNGGASGSASICLGKNGRVSEKNWIRPPAL